MGRRKVEISREIIDGVLTMSDNKLDFEQKICNQFILNDYSEGTDEERELIRKLYHFILEREIMMIELTLRYMKTNNLYV